MTSTPVQPLEAAAASDFRTMMSGFPTGVTVVTAYTPEGAPCGMTCSAVCSVTLEPPTLLACLRNGSGTLAAALATGSFAVNLLHDGARRTAELFGSQAPDRFAYVPWRATARGAGPGLFEDAHAVADCRVTAAHHVGSHTVILGQVLHVVLESTSGPLLYGLREYAAWPPFRL
ncbi:flavin reductase family protein [Streptomyces sp. H10-C2]|uniref:flavin reductase family protein n=1 Tax=unclassified Streptomyces TaxID=2593676 RepID=UPI0024B8EB5F|nr:MULTISPECIES: flavin reductase family protein [unclassified Streptomyces]MDJ0345999.1 flavin reductase family protein [Streptomyces sp. PH10-H1]MDJ0370494.1 flavin reductase family protein [Streptomyces sp. H10-C2]